MGRLIDGTIQALPITNYILERKDTIIDVLQKGDNDFLFAMMMDYFDMQPTAYDVNSVVAKLEKSKHRAERLRGNPHMSSAILCGWEGATDNAIGIVKRGGAE